MYLSITGVTPEGKLSKYQPFETQSEAQSHAREHDGFVVQDPGGDPALWVVDADAETVTRNTSAENAKSAEMLLKSIRTQREPLLKEADNEIFKLEDAEGSTTDWRTYRQALRDVTDQEDLTDITWPTKP